MFATECLKWALANPGLAQTGVWAATTKRERKRLRKRLVARLGDDWPGVVADQDRRRREQQRAARTVPPTVRDQALARLELELVPTRPEPCNPWKQLTTPQQAAANRRVLERALTARRPEPCSPTGRKPLEAESLPLDLTSAQQLAAAARVAEHDMTLLLDALGLPSDPDTRTALLPLIPETGDAPMPTITPQRRPRLRPCPRSSFGGLGLTLSVAY
ncbi:hypothetical protein [Streptomyces rubiginosohelvolus]|uniref:hypothetical protein n=1 Tax=Streptomyces rubiginosohelvolus TaxID=67362 RepID=UPI0037AC8C57